MAGKKVTSDLVSRSSVESHVNRRLISVKLIARTVNAINFSIIESEAELSRLVASSRSDASADLLARRGTWLFFPRVCKHPAIRIFICSSIEIFVPYKCGQNPDSARI